MVASLFSILESLMDAGLVIGVVVVRITYAIGGLRATLVTPAVLAVVLVAAFWRRLRQLDDSAVVPWSRSDCSARCRSSPPCHRRNSKGWPRNSTPVPVRAGTTVFHEGDVGDRYYAVSSGSLCIVRQGALVQTVTRGQGFGEIALIRGVPRQATVTAQSDALLYSLEKELFVVTVSGHAGASIAARHIIEKHIGGMLTLRSRTFVCPERGLPRAFTAVRSTTRANSSRSYRDPFAPRAPG